MTARQKQQRRMAIPRKTEKQRATRERYLFTELARLGYEIAQVGAYQYYIRKAAA